MHIALFANSKAANGEPVKTVKTLRNYLLQQQVKHTVFIDNWATSTQAFSQIWVIGGDGTINYYINNYAHCSTPVAFIKGGTGNDLSTILYGNINALQQAKIALHATPKPVDVGICNNKYFINGVGIGFDGEVLKNMNTIRFIGGNLGYMLVLLKKIFTFKEHKLILHYNQQTTSNPLMICSIFNSKTTGGGIPIAPHAVLNDGLLNCVFCHKLSIIKRLYYLSKLKKGKHLNLPKVFTQNTNCITVSANKVVPAQIDGELYYSQTFNIKVKAQQLQVLY